MKSTALESIRLFEDVQSAYESLEESEKNLIHVSSTMETACRLVNEVKTFGYTDITADHLKHFEALEELVNLSVEKIIQFKATEGLAQGAKEGIKKFFLALGDMVKRVMEFLSKLFNTFSNKCRTLLMNLPNIQFDKKVQSIEKDRMTKIVGVTKNLNDELSKHSIGLRNGAAAMFNNLGVFTQIASASYGLFNVDKDYSLSINQDMLAFKEQTLGDGKWSIGDCRNLVVSYQTREKSYTTIGSYLYRFFTEYLMTSTYGLGEDGMNMRRSMRLDCLVYSMLSKIQHIWTKQIMAFYKCLGPGIKFADGDDGAGAPQLAYNNAA